LSNILELNGVSKTFPKFALKNVSFALPEGFIMGFIGRNGAGKTTTIKLILNMLKKDSGAIRLRAGSCAVGTGYQTAHRCGDGSGFLCG